TLVEEHSQDGEAVPVRSRGVLRRENDVDHGLVAVGKDAINAEHTAELIEETAQVAILKVTVSKLGL
ncbi:hypothetical protein PMX27_26220, partial [Enterocloster clostridioformis]|nr:hypothetical protein [Enterocloster clostridioformis]